MTNVAKPVSPVGAAPGQADAISLGLNEISKQLVGMADDLPLLQQCMSDVKAGKYTTSCAAKIAAGGKCETSIDPATG